MVADEVRSQAARTSAATLEIVEVVPQIPAGFNPHAYEPRAEELARRLLAEPEVQAIGLGARDSLRLEAGLCLYGRS